MGGEGASRRGRSRRRGWVIGTTIALLAAVPLVVALLLPGPAVLRSHAAESAEVQAVPPPVPPRPFDAPALSAAAESAGAPSAARVYGRIVDPDGDPVAGAFISCEDRDHEVAQNANREGRFELPPDADGCRAVATGKGFSPSAPTVLHAGAEVTVRLEPAGSIEGVVVDERGAPVGSYKVGVETFTAAGSGEPLIGGASAKVDDPSGKFALRGLEPGKYILAASTADRPPARSARVDVDAGRATRYVRIILGRGATLVGRVVDADTNKPISGAAIKLDSASYAGVSTPEVASDAAGAFRLSISANEPSSIRVTREGYRTQISTVDARGAQTANREIALHASTDGNDKPEVGGIGAILAPSPRGAVVASVFPGGAGARAGLQKGDRIARIDGAATDDFTVPECIQRLRGAAGTRVVIQVTREGEAPRDITVTRETYTPP